MVRSARKSDFSLCIRVNYAHVKIYLPQKWHTASQFIDLFLCSTNSYAEILQTAFGNLTHLFNKFLVSFAALGQIREVHHRQILKFRLVQLLPDFLDDFRGAFQDRYGKFDNAQVDVAALIGNIDPDYNSRSLWS